MNFEEAQDFVFRNKLWMAMRRVNVNEKWINIIKKFKYLGSITTKEGR